MTGIDIAQLKYDVVEPALVAIGMASTAALNLVTGTALAESGGVFLKQIGGGPALGLWEMEPATEIDCWANWLDYQPALSAMVKALLWPYNTTAQRTNQLIGNLPYGAAMCRIRYRRAAPPLPAYNDAAGMAAYWKQNYNSALGAGAADVAHATLFKAAINA